MGLRRRRSATDAGRDKNVGLLRKALGELVVPLGALAGISLEQGKKSGRLRLRLRDGADPLLHATGGRLSEPHDPYQLTVDSDRYGVAEYFVDEVRNALLLDQVPTDPVTGPAPGPGRPPVGSAATAPPPSTASTSAWSGTGRRRTPRPPPGARTLALTDVVAVEWQPAAGLENGHLRFTVRHAPTKAPPKYDPNSVELWGFKKDPLMALVAAAVQAKLPHPAGPPPSTYHEADIRPETPSPSGRPRRGRSRRPPAPSARAR